MLDEALLLCEKKWKEIVDFVVILSAGFMMHEWMMLQNSPVIVSEDKLAPTNVQRPNILFCS